VTKRLKIGPCSFQINVGQCFNSTSAKFDDKIRRGTLDIGFKVGVVFDFVTLSRKRCETELTSQ